MWMLIAWLFIGFLMSFFHLYRLKKEQGFLKLSDILSIMSYSIILGFGSLFIFIGTTIYENKDKKFFTSKDKF